MMSLASGWKSATDTLVRFWTCFPARLPHIKCPGKIAPSWSPLHLRPHGSSVIQMPVSFFTVIEGPNIPLIGLDNSFMSDPQNSLSPIWGNPMIMLLLNPSSPHLKRKIYMEKITHRKQPSSAAPSRTEKPDTISGGGVVHEWQPISVKRMSARFESLITCFALWFWTICHCLATHGTWSQKSL